MELTKEKSEELALLIEVIKLSLYQIDLDYAKAAVKQMMERAHWQDSAMVLNPGHDPIKTQLLMKQARILDKIVDLVAALTECEELKRKVAENRQVGDGINQLFI